MRRQLKMTVLLGIAGLIPVLALRAQQPPTTARASQPSSAASAKAETSSASTDPIDRIKEEGLKKSQVMATLSYLTDVIGPRLTGSPNMKRANEWTRDQLAAWGLSDAHLEAWGPFGRGWSLKRFSAQVIEPQCIPLIAYPEGVVAGHRGDPDGIGDLLRCQDRGRLRPVQGQGQRGDRSDGPGHDRRRPLRTPGQAEDRLGAARAGRCR